MTRAGRPPRPAADEPPLSILIDFDGTISLLDVGDALLARFVGSPEVARLDARYAAGLIGSRALLAWDMDVLPPDPGRLQAAAAAIPSDPAFGRFVARARSARVELEVVSDGLGFYVQGSLDRLGLGDLPVATNTNRLVGGGAGMTFPYGHPHCFVCGTCKRERVRAHQAAGRAVVFIGDGASDRYAAFYADLVFAKDQLAELCQREGWPFRAWTDFATLAGWLADALAGGDLPLTPAALAGWLDQCRSAARLDCGAGGSGFICGPEAWGADRSTPPPSPGRA
ncbi:MAG: HAD-IB family phosphatase [Candidatus Limnocylindrales bacterium]